MLRAIVFDFDGVLANSEPLHFQSFRDVLAASGVVLTEMDYYARYLGYDDAGAFAAIGNDQRRTWTRQDIVEFVARKAERMTELERNVSVLFPGAAETVRRAAATMPIAIASGALGHEIRRVLDRENLTACFSAIVAAEDTLRSKPAPDPLRKGGRTSAAGACRGSGTPSVSRRGRFGVGSPVGPRRGPQDARRGTVLSLRRPPGRHRHRDNQRLGSCQPAKFHGPVTRCDLNNHPNRWILA